MIVNAPDAAALAALGERIGRRCFSGAVLLLDGDLGAGKTTFTQGLARGLGTASPVLSPTYAIVHEHPEGRLPLYHADVYRIEDETELLPAGITERVGEDGVWVIEWASRFPGAWPTGRLEVTLGVTPDGRRVELCATDAAHEALLAD